MLSFKPNSFVLGGRGSKITAFGNCSHEIKRCLLLGIKAMTKLDSILKNKDKGPSSQSYGFSSSQVWSEMLLNCGVGEDS